MGWRCFWWCMLSMLCHVSWWHGPMGCGAELQPKSNMLHFAVKSDISRQKCRRFYWESTDQILHDKWTGCPTRVVKGVDSKTVCVCQRVHHHPVPATLPPQIRHWRWLVFFGAAGGGSGQHFWRLFSEFCCLWKFARNRLHFQVTRFYGHIFSHITLQVKLIFFWYIWYYCINEHTISFQDLSPCKYFTYFLSNNRAFSL